MKFTTHGMFRWHASCVRSAVVILAHGLAAAVGSAQDSKLIEEATKSVTAPDGSEDSAVAAPPAGARSEQVRAFALRNGLAVDCAARLNCFNFKAQIVADPNANTILASGDADELQIIEALLRRLDEAPPAGAGTEQIKVFALRFGSAVECARLLNDLKFKAQIAADARTNTIVASGAADELQIIEALLLRLDQAPPGAADEETRVETRPASNDPSIGLTIQSPATDAIPDLPEAKQLVEQLSAQESAAAAEAATIRRLQANGQAEQNQPAIAEHQRTLKNLLSTAFDLKLQLEELQVLELRSRLDRLERQIEQRRELREKIINRRAGELINGNARERKSSGVRLSSNDTALAAEAPTTAPATKTAAESLGGSGEESPPDLRLKGDEVSVDGIARLADRHWGCVSLYEGRFNGEIIERLRHAGSIRALRLFGPGLSGQIARLDHVPGLVDLQIGSPLTGRDLEAIGRLTRLERLSLPKELAINVSDAREIAQLTNLKSLGLCNVNIDDSAFVELGLLTGLEELDLTHTRITDEGLTIIEKMPRLKNLQLHRHPAWHLKQQLTDACLRSITCLPELETLSLSGKITNAGLEQLGRLPKLKSLMLMNTEITGEGLGALKDSPVETMTLPAHLMGDSALEQLQECRALKSLEIIGEIHRYQSEMDKWQRRLPKIGWSFNS